MILQDINKKINKVKLLLFPPSYAKLVDMRSWFDSDSPPQALYFGDSVVERISKNDKDSRTLGQMVKNELQGQLSTVVVSHSSYSQIMFLHFVRALGVMHHAPQFVIIPINLRSFSPQWDMQPYWQFEEEQDAIRAFIAKPGARIKAVSNKNVNDIPAAMMTSFRNISVSYPFSDFTKIGQFVDVIEATPLDESGKKWRKKQIFIFHYMHRLEAGHRQLIALQDILSLLVKLNVRAFFYITPINVQAGERFVGPEFRRQVISNAGVVKNVIGSFLGMNKIRFLDWSTLFDSHYFFDNDLATEHINEVGRRELSQRIRSEVLAL